MTVGAAHACCHARRARKVFAWGRLLLLVDGEEKEPTSACVATGAFGGRTGLPACRARSAAGAGAGRWLLLHIAKAYVRDRGAHTYDP